MSFERNGVRVTERGWAGHFICADKCRFRRNTLLEYADKKWIVSTVGAMPQPEALRKIPEFCSENGFDTIGLNRYYETMAFEAQSVKDADGNIIYYDTNVSKIIDDRIPIIRKINKKTYTPELLFYKNRKKIGSLKGVRQVKEIVSYIDKMSLM